MTRVRPFRLLASLVATAAVACSRPPALSPAEVDRGPTAALAPATPAPASAGRLPMPLPARAALHIAGLEQGPSFSVELARTEPERRQGLMFRERLAPDAGMLFFMPGESDWTFWMRNTYLSLDMLFLDAQLRVVGIVERVPPLNDAPRGCGVPSRFVLELGAGIAARHGIRRGTRFELETPSASTRAP